MKVQIINGPNLNLLGKREEEVYGSLNLQEIEEHTKESLKKENIELSWWQSNSESEIIDKVQSLIDSDCDALIINPAAYSHTSIAILDALKVLNIPIIEVHLSNTYARENYRHSMLTAQAASIIMSGLGKDAYYYAALSLLREGNQ